MQFYSEKGEFDIIQWAEEYNKESSMRNKIGLLSLLLHKVEKDVRNHFHSNDGIRHMNDMILACTSLMFRMSLYNRYSRLKGFWHSNKPKEKDRDNIDLYTSPIPLSQELIEYFTKAYHIYDGKSKL